MQLERSRNSTLPLFLDLVKSKRSQPQVCDCGAKRKPLEYSGFYAALTSEAHHPACRAASPNTLPITMMRACALALFALLGSARAQRSGGTVDCTDIATLFADVNTKCCNGGGHRRAQGYTQADPPSECVLSRCTPACAEVFVAMMEDCQPDLPVTGSAFSIIDQIPGADRFLGTCHDVLDAARPPPPTSGTWEHVYGQFLAVDPGMRHSGDTHGYGARDWGVWRTDPGNTGVHFSGIPALESTGRAPRGWTFDPTEWWVEEHGLIMVNPDPMPPGRYKVVWLNRRAGYVPTVELTITGDSWELSDGATLHDVTHGPCRSAKYTTPARGGQCLPDNVPQRQFPVRPGAVMPDVPGCDRLDYAVLFVDSIWG